MNSTRSLDAWLEWQASLNVKAIDLGLDRVRAVLDKLELKTFANVITVAGTNGKGSTVAGYETWLHNRDYRVASYTSPHVLDYNERIRFGLIAVDDEPLCAAFARVDTARNDVPLTYFEFGTLAALVLIDDYAPDYTVLEVGLGGRLDAVNVVDPSLAHITPIGLDHQAWLGDDRESIGREKAGILRPRGKAVCTDTDPPQSVLRTAADLQCDLMLAGRDYQVSHANSGSMHWQGVQRSLDLELPLAGTHQAQNIGGVLTGLESLGCLDGITDTELVEGFAGLSCSGRLQELKLQGFAGRLIVDVGHNPLAARVMADYLAQIRPPGRVIGLLGMLEDKDVSAFVAELSTTIDEWWLVGLDAERGLSAGQLQQRGADQLAGARRFESVTDAMATAMSSLDDRDIILATGSFLTVEAVFKTQGIHRL